MNGVSLVQQCQTMSVNGVANCAPVRGAASSFPAPFPPPFKGLCSPFENILDPKAIPNKWAKSIGDVFQKGKALANSACDYSFSGTTLPLCHLLWVTLKMVVRTKAKQKFECRPHSCIWVRAKAAASLWDVPLASFFGHL